MPGEVITIKVEGEGEIRRFRLAEERAVYAEVHRLIADAWPGKGAHQATYYTEEELRQPRPAPRFLCKASFPEVLASVARRASQKGGPRILKLKLESSTAAAQEEPLPFNKLKKKKKENMDEKKEKQKHETAGTNSSSQEEGHLVEFGGGAGRGGVFKKFRCVVRALKESDALTPLALSSLLVNWLPSLLSCLKERSGSFPAGGLSHHDDAVGDRLENMPVLPGAPSVVEALRLAATKTPGLQCFAEEICAFTQQTETTTEEKPATKDDEQEEEGGGQEGTQEQSTERKHGSSKVRRSVWPLRDLVGEELLEFWQAVAKLPFETQMRVVSAAANPSVRLLKNLYLAKPPELGKVWCASWCPPWAGIPPGALPIPQSCC